MTAFWVFLGGGLGSVARWSLDQAWQRAAAGGRWAHFPAGIVFCNLVGCFLIGTLAGSLASRPVPGWVVPFFSIGFLGGFTTFSTFAKGAVDLMAGGHATAAFLKVILSVVGGLVLAWLGWRLGSATA